VANGSSTCIGQLVALVENKRLAPVGAAARELIARQTGPQERRHQHRGRDKYRLTHKPAESWHVLADQLTPEQIQELVETERLPERLSSPFQSPTGAELQAKLLRTARADTGGNPSVMTVSAFDP
jgi:hypothetical protein